MSADVKPLAASNSLKLNQIMLAGRIEHVSKFDNRFDHIVITPAADAYSKPSVVRVNSAERLGDAGEEVKVLCVYNGWPNNYEGKDGSKIKDVRGYFVAVE